MMAAEDGAHEPARNLEIADGGIERDREGIVPDVAEEFFHGVIVESFIVLGLGQDTVRSCELHACVLESQIWKHRTHSKNTTYVSSFLDRRRLSSAIRYWIGSEYLSDAVLATFGLDARGGAR